MPAINDEAICLRHWDWSETSQTALLFARGMGLIRGLAKGSRRPKSPFSGGIDILARGRIGVIVRPNSELALLTEWDLAETFPALRSNLRAHNAGLYMADVINHAIHDHDPHTALYDATIECLRLLRTGDDVPPALLKFQWSVLVETGYRPELDMDIRSGEELVEAGAYLFGPDAGGFTPESAGGAQGDGAPVSGIGRTWRVRGTTVELLRALRAGGLEGVARLGLGSEGVERANRLLASHLRYVLGTEPPTMGLVFAGRLAR